MLQAPHAPHSWAPWQQPETEALWARIAHLEAYARELEAELDRARHCPVTGLWTRGAWEREARQIVATGPAVVLLADLDGFKPVNDRYGHDTGDAVLRIVGRRITTWCASLKAVAGRLGGDEFAVVLPAGPRLAGNVDDLREAVAVPVRHGGHTVSVGVSIGIGRCRSGWSGDSAARLSSALKSADEAMYREKAVHHGGVLRDRRGRPVARPDTAPEPAVVPALVIEG